MIAKILGIFLTFSMVAAGTVVSTGSIRQPVNLGPEADPARIPIGGVPCESNHGYGVLGLIATPFPLVHGGWRWDGGIELNGNLPSAFGISVEPEDPTDVPRSPVTVRVRRQPVPGYSPYSKEQVLLATLRCLLDSVTATTRQPLTIEVMTEDPADEALRRFSGEYVTRVTRAQEDEGFAPTPLPGCRVEVDENGAAAVVFERIERRGESRKPLWMPFLIEGDADSGHLLLPIWTANTFEGDPLDPLGMPWPVVRDLFNPAVGDPDANLLTRRNRLGHFGVSRAPDRVAIRAHVAGPQDEATAREMALLCWAAVLTEAPTAALPMEIVLRVNGSLGEVFQAWRESGWERVEMGGDPALRGWFVWDRAGRKLVKGSIPGVDVRSNEGGGWQVIESGELPAVPGASTLPERD